jgi:hypothetical protein
MDEAVRFALEHLEEWRELHPNSWIAVYDGELAAVAPSRERLLEALARKQVPLGEVYLDFLSEEKADLVL